MNATAPPAAVVEVLRHVNLVCFDVDSTVISDEGIDVLARTLGKSDVISALTASAMNGAVPFDVALTQRLNILRPTRQHIESFMNEAPFRLTDGIADVIRLLRQRGIHIALVSGGFRQMIRAVQTLIDVDDEDVYANNLLFTESGEYAGFDTNEPTAWAGGKAKAVATAKAKLQARSGADKKVVAIMIGDGATDLEARPVVDCMIGYGGIVVRPAVRAGADWFIYDWKALITILQTEQTQSPNTT